MVWFQCDDCGDNLKKPKLVNHFRSCRASRFSCIDCGAVFDRQSVQQHTQCISEAEKYGPKGEKNGSEKKDKRNGGVDEELVNFGLSTRPPWSCSLCNIKATSRDTLLVHGSSKRHLSKARNATEQPNDKQGNGTAMQESGVTVGEEQETKQENKTELKEKQEDEGEKKPKPDILKEKQENGRTAEETEEKKPKDKKRKLEPAAADGEEEGGETRKEPAAVKWRKLVSKQLKESSDGSMKRRKLEKAVLPLAVEAAKAVGVSTDESLLKTQLREYISSSTRFELQGKYVRFAVKENK